MKIPPWLLFVVTAVIEYTLFSYLFDVKELLGPAGISFKGGLTGTLAPLIIVAAAATAITGGAPAHKAMGELARFRKASTAGLLWAAAHAIFFASGLLIAEHIAKGTALTPDSAKSWLAIWILSPPLSVASLGLTIWDPSALRKSIMGMRSSLKVGLATGLIAWLAGLGASYLWKPLTRLTLELVHAQLTVIASDPVASIEHSLVGTSRFYVHVAPVCSGVEGIGLMTTFMSAFLFLKRAQLKWPRSIALLPASVIGIWLLNSVRLTLLVAVGTWGSPEVALGGFHSKAGWVLFTAACLATIALVERSSYFTHEQQPGDAGIKSVAGSVQMAHQPDSALSAGMAVESGTSEADSAESAYLLPLLAVLAVSLVSGLASSGFDHFYPLRVIVAAVVLYRFRGTYPARSFSAPWLGIGVGVLIAVIWIVGFRQPDGGEATTGERLASLHPAWASIWLVLRLIGGIVTVPIVEELAFRGYLMRRLARREFDEMSFRESGWLGLLGSSMAFGVLHTQWALGILAGVAFGLLAMARGRLGDAILAHSVANAGLAAYALYYGQWALLG